MEKPSFKDKQEQLASLKKRFARTSNAELLKEMRKLEDELKQAAKAVGTWHGPGGNYKGKA